MKSGNFLSSFSVAISFCFEIFYLSRGKEKGKEGENKRRKTKKEQYTHQQMVIYLVGVLPRRTMPSVKKKMQQNYFAFFFSLSIFSRIFVFSAYRGRTLQKKLLAGGRGDEMARSYLPGSQ